jgi:hypothetical protein
VKRVIQDLVLNALSKKILAAEIDNSRPIVIDAAVAGLDDAQNVEDRIAAAQLTIKN